LFVIAQNMALNYNTTPKSPLTLAWVDFRVDKRRICWNQADRL